MRGIRPSPIEDKLYIGILVLIYISGKGLINGSTHKTFLQIQKEMTELTKAAGYNKATMEFSRLRPVGSKLPDTDKRTVTLFDNTNK